jgi:hypothetical protein
LNCQVKIASDHPTQDFGLTKAVCLNSISVSKDTFRYLYCLLQVYLNPKNCDLSFLR